jgi:hypothetical protein
MAQAASCDTGARPFYIMNEGFFNGIYPQRFAILGRKLRPLSIAHEIALEKLENGYRAESERPPSKDDLCQAIYVCTRRFSEITFPVPLTSRIWSKIITNGTSDSDFRAAEASFKTYLEYHRQVFEFTQHSRSGGEKRVRGADFKQRLIQFLICDLGLNYNAALDCPINRAMNDFIAHAENKGGITIVDSIEAMQNDLLEQQEDIIAKAMRM